MKYIYNKAFAIVELLIVIVVIAILATLTIVAYNGIQNGAKTSSLQSDLSQAAKQLDIYKYTNSETYPVDQTAAIAAGVKASGGNTITYYNNSSSNSYCLQSTNSNITYSISSTSTSPTVGPCTENSLVGWWKLDGNANDSTSNGNNGTITGATLTTGQSGQANGAYNFDGSSYIKFPQVVPTGLTRLTVSVWARAISYTGGNYGTIIHRSSNTAIGSSIFWAGVNTLGQYALAANGNWASGSTGTVANTSTWRLLTLVYNGNTQRVYSDGAFSASANVGPITNQSTSTEISIGASANSTADRTLTGDLDDIRIYNRALSDAEVSALYAAGAQ